MYHVLVHLNTKRTAGWLVCNYFLSGCCSITKAVKEFDTHAGTSTLMTHTATHESNKRRKLVPSPIGVSVVCKKRVKEAAIREAVLGSLPFSFVYQKPGMIGLASALVEVGKGVPMDEKVNVTDLLPTPTSISTGVRDLAKDLREQFRTLELPQLLRRGGGLSCDGLKLSTTGTNTAT